MLACVHRFLCANFTHSSTPDTCCPQASTMRLIISIASSRISSVRSCTLLYARNDIDFKNVPHQFDHNTPEHAPAFLRYFVKNWVSYRDMWANSRQGKRFTTGITATNRMESSWYQQKQTLGQIHSIAVCTAAIWRYQLRVMSSISSEVNRWNGRSRRSSIYHVFLEDVLHRSNDSALVNVVDEYDTFMVAREKLLVSMGAGYEAWYRW